jgi:hypothetical protein
MLFPGVLLASAYLLQSAPVALDSRIHIRHIMDAGTNSFRIVKDPRNDVLYYLKVNGDIYQVKLAPEGRTSTSKRIYRSTDHKVYSAAGIAIGGDGTIYLTGNEVITNHTIATVTKGIIDANTGKRLWSVLAQTEPYPGLFFFNHQMNGIAISPDGGSLFVNIGARTEHGEVSDYDGLFPGLREVGLTTIILKLPASGENIFLPNDREALRAAGFLFAEGLRNTYDLAFAPNGDLFGTENGPDRDMPDELNWLREGHHYGFPWRMGTEDNPQRFPDHHHTH